MIKKLFAAVLTLCLILACVGYAEEEYSLLSNPNWLSVDSQGFKEGVCAVKDAKTQRWGYVNKTGAWEIAPKFKDAIGFENGCAVVCTPDNEYCLIDRSGNTVFRFQNGTGILRDYGYIKHGSYGIVVDNREKQVFLLGENNNVENYMCLSKFYFAKTTQEPSNTVFYTTDENAVMQIYNYRGENITNALRTYDVNFSNQMPTSDRYIIGCTSDKIIVFNIFGEKISEITSFSTNYDDIYIYGDSLIVTPSGKQINVYGCLFGGIVYDIATGEERISFNDKNYYLQTYYDKYLVVNKPGATSALYSFDGKLLMDFGTYDYIVPFSVGEKASVQIANRWGIFDYQNNNLLCPIEYVDSSVRDRYTVLATKDNLTCYDAVTNKYVTSANPIVANGISNYVLAGKVIYDKNLNYVATMPNGYHAPYSAPLDEGVVIVMHKNTNPKSYAFMVFENSGIKVKLDGKNLVFDEFPSIVNDRTLVPLRTIFESLNATVTWNAGTQTVTATRGNIVISLQIGNNKMLKNNQEIVLDAPPIISNGRTLVPVRAVAESFGLTVGWDAFSRTVSLFSN